MEEELALASSACVHTTCSSSNLVYILGSEKRMKWILCPPPPKKNGFGREEAAAISFTKHDCMILLPGRMFHFSGDPCIESAGCSWVGGLGWVGDAQRRELSPRQHCSSEGTRGQARAVLPRIPCPWPSPSFLAVLSGTFSLPLSLSLSLLGFPLHVLDIWRARKRHCDEGNERKVKA